MSPFRRRTRRADEWASPHERARTRAAQRLDWPLDPSEAVWLEGHLAECKSCRRRAAEYQENRDTLRTLRDVNPPVPRDLWARTAAAIEVESQRGRRSPVRGFPIGALSGVVVIAVVLGATLLSNAPTTTVAPATDTAASFPPAAATASLLPGPLGTPLAVAAGPVKVLWGDPDGTYGYGTLGVEAVCSRKADADCPMVDDSTREAFPLTAQPQTIIGSPDDEQAIIVSKPDESNANEIIVFALPKGSAAVEPLASEPPASEPPASEPPATETPSETPDTSEPPASESSAPETAPASDEPGTSPEPSETPAETVEPSAEPTPTPAKSEPPEATPTPESIAIASGLEVIGQTEAYSPDGTWFAFTAKPADKRHGPDIYLWKVGTDQAVPATNDHRSVFASWDGEHLVGSRPSGDGPVVEADTFLLDPETGDETAIGGHGWRPVVAPEGNRALVFDGSVATTNDGSDIGPAEGTLKLRDWDAAAGTASGDGTSVLDVSGAPFDARWDETGTAFAVWVQDEADPSFGRLSLYFVDSETGELDQPDNAPREEPALPGFSIGEGRLAWATPSGQGGEGSRVQIVAWTDDAVGTAETAPGSEVVVIR
jgi:hypothetical protein